MITPTSRSSRARSSASETSISVCGRKALRTSGRLIVILAIPSPLSSYLMSLYSPSPGVHVTAMGRQATFRPMVVESWLARAARERPDRPAVNGLSYGALHERARAAAGGIPRGARVGLALPPGEAYVTALHAVLLA